MQRRFPGSRTARRGSLNDLGILHEAAASSEGVVHLAFKHDVAFAGATRADRAAIETSARPWPASASRSASSAQITRDLLGWQPTRPELIADLKEGHYFA